MTDNVFRMTKGHLARWVLIYGANAAVWTWLVLTETSAPLRVIEVVFALLAVRGLIGTVAAFARRPSLALGSEALAITNAITTREMLWSDCSEFSPIHKLLGSHVRFRVGSRRKSLPAGFGTAERRLTAEELAHALNGAREASATYVGSTPDA